MRKAIYMATTEISAERTAADITALLVDCGARQIAMDYGEGGKIVGMHFVLMHLNRPFLFRLPVRAEALFQALRKQRAGRGRYVTEAKDRTHAERVAWRQLLMWVRAQLAMIDAGLAPAREIFLPYCQESDGRTVFDIFEETHYKALPPPGTEERRA